MHTAGCQPHRFRGHARQLHRFGGRRARPAQTVPAFPCAGGITPIRRLISESVRFPCADRSSVSPPAPLRLLTFVDFAAPSPHSSLPLSLSLSPPPPRPLPPLLLSLSSPCPSLSRSPPPLSAFKFSRALSFSLSLSEGKRSEREKERVGWGVLVRFDHTGTGSGQTKNHLVFYGSTPSACV